jgi:hypothetical protein
MEVFASNTEKIREILKESPPDKIQENIINFCVHLSSFINAYFDNSINPTTRKYTLNNQYILEDSTTISRNMNLIITELYNFTNNIENYSYYGIELNSLLKYLSYF